MTIKPDSINIANIFDKEFLKELIGFSEKIEQYYLSQQNEAIIVFNSLIGLIGKLLFALDGQLIGFIPKYALGSQIQKLVTQAAIGSLRGLIVAYILSVRGFFTEAHGMFRTVMEWLVCSLVAEGSPESALRVIEKGISNKIKEKTLKSSKEIRILYNSMKKNYEEFSERVHVRKAALSSMKIQGIEDAFSVGPACHDELFRRDSMALATMAINTISILIRHFNKIPNDYLTDLNKLNQKLEEIKKSQVV